MKTFSLQKQVIDKLKQLLLFSTELYEFSINPPPNEPYCFYKVPMYLSQWHSSFCSPYSFTPHDSEQVPFTGALNLVRSKQVVVKKVMSACGLIDWLIVWLIGWSIDWLINRSIDWLIVWLIDRLIGWSIDWLIDWSIDWLIDRSIDWLIDWLINWLIDWSIDWLTHWLVDQLIDWLIDWFIDWLVDDGLTHWLINQLIGW